MLALKDLPGRSLSGVLVHYAAPRTASRSPARRSRAISPRMIHHVGRGARGTATAYLTAPPELGRPPRGRYGATPSELRPLVGGKARDALIVSI
jgi:hypothetical protein